MSLGIGSRVCSQKEVMLNNHSYHQIWLFSTAFYGIIWKVSETSAINVRLLSSSYPDIRSKKGIWKEIMKNEGDEGDEGAPLV